MQYYSINYSSDPSIVGSTFPQSQDAHHSVNVDDPAHLWNHFVGKSIGSAVLPELVFHPKAKLTDLVSSSTKNTRLVLSKKLKDLLFYSIDGRMGEFMPITIWQRGTAIPYWIFNPLGYQFDIIDFEHSEIWLLKSGREQSQQFFGDANSFQKMIEHTSYPEQIMIKLLKIKQNVHKDFFAINYLKKGLVYYVSELLKEKIEHSGCTGIEFEQIES